MNHTFKIVSLLALLATIVPSFLFLGGMVSHDAVKLTAWIGTIGWFIATPLWMERKTA
ncbi:MAG: hypothetical protein ABL921_12190 [Pirellula sp.]